MPFGKAFLSTHHAIWTDGPGQQGPEHLPSARGPSMSLCFFSLRPSALTTPSPRPLHTLVNPAFLSLLVVGTSSSLVFFFSSPLSSPALASDLRDRRHDSIPTRQERQRQALLQLGIPVAPMQPEPKSKGLKEGSTREAVADVMELTTAAEVASAKGNFSVALDRYSTIVQRYPDLAVTERARVSRALLLYQLGHVEDALLALEDEEVILRGSPEVNVALCAVLYVERPYQRERAESLWDAATSLDGRWSDTRWVEEEKHWPPKMVAALQRFLTLS